MFGKNKKMWTDTSKSIFGANQISVTYSCGHEGRRRSMYFDMVSPSALENYLEFLETTKCADCAAVERATEKVSEKARKSSPIAGAVEEMALRPAV